MQPNNIIIIIGVDPGPTSSAYVVLEDGRIASSSQQDNADLEESLRHSTLAGTLAIEQVRSYGRPVGEEVFATVYWSGRFAATWLYLASIDRKVIRYPWPEVAGHFCHATHGVKESHVRQVLIDRFGPGRRKAIGLKKKPGPLYGLKGHMWSAAAIAFMAYDLARGIQDKEQLP